MPTTTAWCTKTMAPADLPVRIPCEERLLPRPWVYRKHPQSICLIHYNLSWVFEHWVHISASPRFKHWIIQFLKGFSRPFWSFFQIPSRLITVAGSPVEVWVGIPVWRRPWCGDGSEDLEAGNGSSCKLVLGARHWAFLGSIKMFDAYLAHL